MGCADICVTTHYDNAPDFHVERTVRGAKAHRCCECGDEMPVGTQHEYVWGKWGGEPDTYRTCLACVEVRNTFCCDGWVYSTLWDDISEQLFPEWRKNLTNVECLAKLKTDAAVAKMREMYAEWDDELTSEESPDAP